MIDFFILDSEERFLAKFCHVLDMIELFDHSGISDKVHMYTLMDIFVVVATFFILESICGRAEFSPGEGGLYAL